MPNESPAPQRRPQQQARRRPSSAGAILSGKSAVSTGENYFTWDWTLLFATLLTMLMICYLFTPYTHQLDDIKNVILQMFPPFLLIFAVMRAPLGGMTWRTHGSTILLGLYTLFLGFSWLINPYKEVNERVVWFHAGCATFTVVFAWFLNTENKMRKTMIFLVLLGLSSTLFGLFLFKGGNFTQKIYEAMQNSDYWTTPSRAPWATLFYTLKESKGELYSFVLNPDFYAAFLVMLIPISLSMFFVESRMRYKILALVSFLMMNVCLLQTNSNDSYVGIAVSYLAFGVLGLLYVRQWNLSRRFIFTFLGCVTVSVIVMAILMLPTIVSTWDFKSAAYDSRMVLWDGDIWPWIYGDNKDRSAIDPISIIFGVGPGGYRHYFPWFRRPDFFDQQINNVTTFGHNWYLDVLSETGLVGLILFLGFHGRIVLDAFRQMRTTSSRTHLFYQIALMCSFIGIGIQNFTSPNNRWAVAGMTYWALFGLSMGLHHLEHPPVDNRRRVGSGEFGTMQMVRIGLFIAGLVFGAKDQTVIAVIILMVALMLPELRAIVEPAANAPSTTKLFFVKGAVLLFASLFIVRSSMQQANRYWEGSKANSSALRKMEAATDPSVAENYRLPLLQKAREEFEYAIEQNPTFVTSYYKLGHVYNSIGQQTSDPKLTAKAIETYEKLNSLNPSYSEIHLNLGIMYAAEASDLQQYLAAKQAEADEKLAQMNKATGIEKDRLKQEHGELAEAAKTMEAKLPEMRLELSRKSYESMKEAARQSLKPNVQMMAGDLGQELARLYKDAGHEDKSNEVLEEVKKYYRTIITYHPKIEEVRMDQKKYYPKAQKVLVQLAMETEKPDESLDVLKQMVHENPDNQQYLKGLLELYDKVNKPQEKLAFLEGAVHDDPTDAELRQQLAEAYSRANDLEKYQRELRRVEVLLPKDKRTLAELYRSFEKSGLKDKSEEYRKKLKDAGVDPDSLTTASTETTRPASARAGAVRSAATTGALAPTTATAVAAPVTAPAPAVLAPPAGSKSADAVTTGPPAPAI